MNADVRALGRDSTKIRFTQRKLNTVQPPSKELDVSDLPSVIVHTDAHVATHRGAFRRAVQPHRETIY